MKITLYFECQTSVPVVCIKGHYQSTIAPNHDPYKARLINSSRAMLSLSDQGPSMGIHP